MGHRGFRTCPCLIAPALRTPASCTPSCRPLSESAGFSPAAPFALNVVSFPSLDLRPPSASPMRHPLLSEPVPAHPSLGRRLCPVSDGTLCTSLHAGWPSPLTGTPSKEGLCLSLYIPKPPTGLQAGVAQLSGAAFSPQPQMSQTPGYSPHTRTPALTQTDRRPSSALKPGGAGCPGSARCPQTLVSQTPADPPRPAPGDSAVRAARASCGAQRSPSEEEGHA